MAVIKTAQSDCDCYACCRSFAAVNVNGHSGRSSHSGYASRHEVRDACSRPRKITAVKIV